MDIPVSNEPHRSRLLTLVLLAKSRPATSSSPTTCRGRRRVPVEKFQGWNSRHFLFGAQTGCGGLFQEISNKTHWTDPEKTWVSNSSIAPYLGVRLVRSHSIFHGFMIAFVSLVVLVDGGVVGVGYRTSFTGWFQKKSTTLTPPPTWRIIPVSQ